MNQALWSIIAISVIVAAGWVDAEGIKYSLMQLKAKLRIFTVDYIYIEFFTRITIDIFLK